MFLSNIEVGVWGISVFGGITPEEQSNLGAFILREPRKYQCNEFTGVKAGLYIFDLLIPHTTMNRLVNTQVHSSGICDQAIFILFLKPTEGVEIATQVRRKALLSFYFAKIFRLYFHDFSTHLSNLFRHMYGIRVVRCW
jgi:hypothetical protein